MFQPELLMYCQTEGGVYSYLYGAAKISAARDGRRLALILKLRKERMERG